MRPKQLLQCFGIVLCTGLIVWGSGQSGSTPNKNLDLGKLEANTTGLVSGKVIKRESTPGSPNQVMVTIGNEAGNSAILSGNPNQLKELAVGADVSMTATASGPGNLTNPKSIKVSSSAPSDREIILSNIKLEYYSSTEYLIRIGRGWQEDLVVSISPELASKIRQGTTNSLRIKGDQVTTVNDESI